MTTAEDVRQFWFGDDRRDEALQKRVPRWFGGKDVAFDALVKERFLGTWERARKGELAAWEREAPDAVALIVVLDQLPRHMFRRTAQAFASDGEALAVAKRVTARGLDRELPALMRAFVYLPFEHAEDAAAQRECCALYRQLASEATPALKKTLDEYVRYADRHAEIVTRFGRFPHRNAALERASTAEELAFLKEPGSSF